MPDAPVASDYLTRLRQAVLEQREALQRIQPEKDLQDTRDFQDVNAMTETELLEEIDAFLLQPVQWREG